MPTAKKSVIHKGRSESAFEKLRPDPPSRDSSRWLLALRLRRNHGRSSPECFQKRISSLRGLLKKKFKDNSDHKSRQANPRFIIGIDEAGRGPLAGPLVVAGVKINSKFAFSANSRASPVESQAVGFRLKKQNAKLLKGIKDSKKLSAKKREEWFKILTGDPRVKWAVAKISPEIIDKINIARAANLGAKIVFQKLSGYKNCRALLDGSLYLPKNITQKTIIKGDEKIPIISAASIIAKVTRDRTMTRLHKKYPQYGFKNHKGYGTKSHYEAIKKFGLCCIHRRSFNLSH